MRKIIHESDYENVYIVPRDIRGSSVISRSDVDTSKEYYSLCRKSSVTFDLPLMLSPMSFFGVNSILEVNNRFLTFIPRIKRYQFPGESYPIDWSDINVRLSWAKILFEQGYNFGVSFGLKDSIEDIKKFIPYTDFLLIDTASGYSSTVHSFIKELREVTDRYILSGNVISIEGFNLLRLSGCDLVRVSIGAGANCITSDCSAIGRSSLSSILEINDLGSVISDGGIKNSHDFCLSTLFSTYSMVSGLFRYTELNEHVGTFYKVPSYGMASSYAKSGNDYIEGKLTYGNLESFEDKYKELKEGLQSAMSYLGASNLEEYRNSKFDLVTKG